MFTLESEDKRAHSPLVSKGIAFRKFWMRKAIKELFNYSRAPSFAFVGQPGFW